MKQDLKQLEEKNKALEEERQNVINKLEIEKSNTEKALKENEDLKSQITITSVGRSFYFIANIN